ncbi:DUF362 domain-containing protein [Candidatus Bathyarchaeota archaeon]|nr:DUF362 domain-containing protein [Candidatus Bathyarchaeota archaeon]
MPSEIFLVQGDNRAKAISQLFDQFNLKQFSKKQIALKANYNSADPFPAQTHPETLKLLVKGLQDAGAKEIVMGERSGMGDTRKILEKSGIIDLAKKLKFTVTVLNDLPFSGWLHFDLENSHWNRGFLFARLFIDADAIIQTCCLKTHQFGGHFTLSLKNSVGMVAHYNPQDGYDYMNELHGSPHQREMIAEINTAYEPALVLMDGTTAFVKGGPAMGTKVSPNIFLAGSDRIAIDAVGVALLRHYGTTPEVEKGTIFDQTQLARAIQLGLGASSLHDIKLVPLDEHSEKVSEEILAQFAK